MDGVAILVAKVMRKTPQSYDKIRRGNERGKPGNPSSPHEFNYAITDTFKTDFATLGRIKAGNHVELAKIRSRLREKGEKGVFILEQPLGGPGRRGTYETREEWLGKRKSGMVEIARIKV